MSSPMPSPSVSAPAQNSSGSQCLGAFTQRPATISSPKGQPRKRQSPSMREYPVGQLWVSEGGVHCGCGVLSTACWGVDVEPLLLTDELAAPNVGDVVTLSGDKL